jgi:hypothetical protein
MRSVVERNVFVRRIPVLLSTRSVFRHSQISSSWPKMFYTLRDVSFTGVVEDSGFWNVMPFRLVKLRIIRHGVISHKTLISKSVNSFISILIRSFLLP